MPLITFQKFLDTWDGKYCEYSDPKNRYQCQDLMRQYVQDVLGLPQSALPGALYAKDVFKNYHGTAFQKIPNTPLGIPKAGDIIFTGFYPFVTGWAGHVGIVVGDGSSIYNYISFDQNFPSGSSCHRQLHNYRGTLGWLRKA